MLETQEKLLDIYRNDRHNTIVECYYNFKNGTLDLSLGQDYLFYKVVLYDSEFLTYIKQENAI